MRPVCRWNNNDVIWVATLEHLDDIRDALNNILYERIKAISRLNLKVLDVNVNNPPLEILARRIDIVTPSNNRPN